jgi:hypothetical protein
MKILRSGALWTFLAYMGLIFTTAYMEDLGHLKCSFVVFLAYLIAYSIGHWYGIQRGKQQEKKRVMALCHQCLNQIWSGSVRRVLNGIQEDRTKILSEDEFFGPKPGVPSMHSSNGSQERPPPNA